MQSISGQKFDLESILASWQEKLALKTDEDICTWISNIYKKIHSDALEIGNFFNTQLLENHPTENYISFAVVYEWMPQVKLFLILLRDSQFEQQKSVIYSLDGSCSQKKIEQLQKNSISLIQQAFGSLSTHYNKLKTTNSSIRKINQWKHQESPWPLYQKQFEKINAQIKQLELDFTLFKELINLFSSINDLTNEVLERNHSQLDHYQSVLNQVLGHLSLDESHDDDPQLLMSNIHKIGDSIKRNNPENHFEEDIELLLKKFDKSFSPIVSTLGGKLVTRTFEPRKDISDWFEALVYPILFEIWELEFKSKSGLKIVLVNLTNRLDILYNDTPKALYSENFNLQKPLIAYNKNLEEISNNISNLIVLIKSRLEQHFKVSLLFHKSQLFLPISLQSTLNSKIWHTEYHWLLKLKTWLSNSTSHLNSFKNNFLLENKLGLSEQIAIAVQSRSLDSANKHYTSIFMTKGYVGDAFIVGRDDELARFSQVVDNWEKGFRGSVLFFGNRFSGKTTILEMVVKKHFANNYCKISPNSTINFQGRKLQCNYDLEEALKFVYKHPTNKKPLIVIDDLELWWSEKKPFFENIQSLMDCIDNYSNRFFFVITTNCLIKTQLNSFCHFNRVFQAQINLNTISQEELQDAISIRHGATHKKIVHAQGQELSLNHFRKYVSKIHKQTQGNIGEGLQRWVNGTLYVDEESILYEANKYKKLPAFLNEDSLLIIEFLLKYKKSNEYQLRQLLGLAFSERYSAIVRRLIHTGILTRNMDGHIEIAPSIVNDLQTIIY